jgi:hypothetical protein
MKVILLVILQPIAMIIALIGTILWFLKYVKDNCLDWWNNLFV